MQVTNDYRTHMSKVKKSGVQITVPDTLYNFDYEFDYSVFESPYKGAYEFTPYLVKMTPETVPFTPKSFYLRAGAGYSLHPELDLVYSPVVKDNFCLNVFGKASGYYGNYSEISDGFVPDSKYSGYDFSDYVGIGGYSMFRKSLFSFTLGHNGAFSTLDPWSGANSGAGSAYNSGFADFRIQSKNTDNVAFCYNIGADVRYSVDAFKNANLAARELDVNADLSLGVSVRNRYKFLMDAKVEFQNLNCQKPSACNMIDLKPHFEFTLGPVFLDAGLKVDFVETQINLYPDVHAECSIGKRHMFTIYADASGGDELNSYHDLKMLNHRFNSTYGDNTYSHTKLKASLGFRGYASTHFTYDLSGGYGIFSNYLMDCLIPLTEGLLTPREYQEGVCYAASYEMAFADARLMWKSDRFDAIVNVAFRYKTHVETTSCYYLPLLSGGITLKYNAAKRLYVWVGANGQTARDYLRSDVSGEDVSLPEIPGFVDLNAGCEYRFSSKLGFWVKGGNLLGQPMRKSLMYVEKSPYVTAGITLSL